MVKRNLLQFSKSKTNSIKIESTSEQMRSLRVIIEIYVEDFRTSKALLIIQQDISKSMGLV
ncbi:CLUMA_CG009470, isoform A [Clunio marinus]|uniref:CLUMA_CG009470, isoform A n=1 Tax=Clunio marinus TaxID=568069 RepID=A0A1J1I6V2_9DIPT|nr:CLUMA_CG009470, isoform A [Clunio marinus]